MIILSEGTSTYLNFFGERFPLSFYIAFTCKIIIRSKIAMTILSSQYKSYRDYFDSFWYKNKIKLRNGMSPY